MTEAEKLRKKLFADLGDKYEFDDSMRSFYTNPNTTIPNYQKGFAEFCYGSCRISDAANAIRYWSQS